MKLPCLILEEFPLTLEKACVPQLTDYISKYRLRLREESIEDILFNKLVPNTLNIIDPHTKYPLVTTLLTEVRKYNYSSSDGSKSIYTNTLNEIVVNTANNELIGSSNKHKDLSNNDITITSYSLVGLSLDYEQNLISLISKTNLKHIHEILKYRWSHLLEKFILQKDSNLISFKIMLNYNKKYLPIEFLVKTFLNSKNKYLVTILNQTYKHILPIDPAGTKVEETGTYRERLVTFLSKFKEISEDLKEYTLFNDPVLKDLFSIELETIIDGKSYKGLSILLVDSFFKAIEKYDTKVEQFMLSYLITSLNIHGLAYNRIDNSCLSTFLRSFKNITYNKQAITENCVTISSLELASYIDNKNRLIARDLPYEDALYFEFCLNNSVVYSKYFVAKCSKDTLYIYCPHYFIPNSETFQCSKIKELLKYIRQKTNNELKISNKSNASCIAISYESLTNYLKTDSLLFCFEKLFAARLTSCFCENIKDKDGHLSYINTTADTMWINQNNYLGLSSGMGLSSITSRYNKQQEVTIELQPVSLLKVENYLFNPVGPNPVEVARLMTSMTFIDDKWKKPSVKNTYFHMYYHMLSNSGLSLISELPDEEVLSKFDILSYFIPQHIIDTIPGITNENKALYPYVVLSTRNLMLLQHLAAKGLEVEESGLQASKVNNLKTVYCSYGSIYILCRDVIASYLQLEHLFIHSKETISPTHKLVTNSQIKVISEI